jgi:hypothetical protein
MVAFILALACSVSAKPAGYGTLSGIVLDPAGTPQMGASVWLVSEDADSKVIAHLLTNQQGAFLSDHLKPGSYSVRVSLAGFLPALEHHVGVGANLTTLLRVQVDSIFASLDQLRKAPEPSSEPDDWKWVLRSSPATRGILQWRDGTVVMAGNSPEQNASQPRGLVEMTSGASHPGSPSNLPDSPATTMSYDQSLGSMGRMIFAGQMSYIGSAAGAFAGVWLPTGQFDGPETQIVMRQSKVGIDSLTFQGMRIDHSEQLALGDRMTLRTGAEFVRYGIVSSVSALHPHAQLDARLAPNWTLTTFVAASPSAVLAAPTEALQSAIDQLDSLPTVMFRRGRPVLEGTWHEEIALRHKMSDKATVEVAGFHEAARHQAIYGSGPAGSLDFFQDSLSNTFLYDGGATDSWGTRVAYRQKLSNGMGFTALYSWAGTLSPVGELAPVQDALRDSLTTRNRHSLSARLSGKLPRTGTQVGVSYKWIAGMALTSQDAFGEAAYQIDPYMHVTVRQPLPAFGGNGRWQVLADFSNLLAEGYTSVNAQESRIVLAPIQRSFRGGVSFQF